MASLCPLTPLAWVGKGVGCGSSHSLGARSIAMTGKSREVTVGDASQGAVLGPFEGLGAWALASEEDQGRLGAASLTLGLLASSSPRPTALLGPGMLGGTTVGGHSQGSGGLLPPGEPAPGTSTSLVSMAQGFWLWPLPEVSVAPVARGGST